MALAQPVPWVAEQAGFYYIDNTHPRATDQDRTFGTPLNPRRSIPVTLPPASVVSVGGGPYLLPSGSSHTYGFEGTAQQPVFVRCSPGVRFEGGLPRGATITFAGQYGVWERCVFENIRTGAGPGAGLRYFSFRHNVIRNWSGSASTAMFSAGRNVPGGPVNEHIVIYDNDIVRNTSISHARERDTIGVVASTGSQDVWVVDNRLQSLGGDSVRTGTNPPAPEPRASHIYIGRNVMGSNGENCVDVKQGREVIISQNTCTDLAPSTGGNSSGEGIVVHYEAQRTWILFNTIQRVTRGIVATAQDDLYIVGNVLRDIVHDPTVDHDFDPLQLQSGGTAVQVRGSTGELFIVNNTITASDRGIWIRQPNFRQVSAIEVVNNLVYGLTGAGSHYGWSAATLPDQSTFTHNLMKCGSGCIQIGTRRYDTLNSFRSAQGGCAGCVSADPVWNAAETTILTLGEKSAARDAGTDRSKVYERFRVLYGRSIAFDRVGNARPQDRKWDIGAFEFTPVKPPRP
uniref:Right handed beta helix domain-containing protein n=1 Tax=uncultured bacterium lac193 TaxID=1447243 RepID=X2LCJ5_9BACT|nr:hypothetical protein [uncultured bacterium lac193]